MVTGIGFLVNPIAGMGGRVGLKGTDGVYDEALKRGAEPIAMNRALQCIKSFKKYESSDVSIKWFTCSGEMGVSVLDDAGIFDYQVIYETKKETTDSADTMNACKVFLKNKIDLLVFCGGDGTARDVVSVVQESVPILGIPSGVKMHSAVFGVTPEASGKMLYEFIQGHLRVGDAEIMDLDEERYRKGEWKVRLYAKAKGLVEPMYIQVGKQMFSEVDESNIHDELYEHVLDDMRQHSDTLYLLGSGGTLDDIGNRLHVDHTLLGIDAVYQEKTVATDVNENQLLTLLSKYHKVKLIISPIGAQGFIFGRGNLQLSPAVIRKIGLDNIMVIATPAKVVATPYLRVDTGDKELDKLFYDHEMMMVVIGYRLFRVVRIQH